MTTLKEYLAFTKPIVAAVTGRYDLNGRVFAIVAVDTDDKNKVTFELQSRPVSCSLSDIMQAIKHLEVDMNDLVYEDTSVYIAGIHDNMLFITDRDNPNLAQTLTFQRLETHFRRDDTKREWSVDADYLISDYLSVPHRKAIKVWTSTLGTGTPKNNLGDGYKCFYSKTVPNSSILAYYHYISYKLTCIPGLVNDPDINYFTHNHTSELYALSNVTTPDYTVMDILKLVDYVNYNTQLPDVLIKVIMSYLYR